MDHCFGGWDGRAEVHWPETGIRLRIEAEPLFGHLVIYIPAGREIFCVEPVSHVNDGFNLAGRGVADTGVRILVPGETLRTSYSPLDDVFVRRPVPSTDTEALPSRLPALSDTVPRMDPLCAEAAAHGIHARRTPDSTLTMPRTMRPPLCMTRVGASGAGNCRGGS